MILGEEANTVTKKLYSQKSKSPFSKKTNHTQKMWFAS
jgi:hypothetical protein